MRRLPFHWLSARNALVRRRKASRPKGAGRWTDERGGRGPLVQVQLHLSHLTAFRTVDQYPEVIVLPKVYIRCEPSKPIRARSFDSRSAARDRHDHSLGFSLRVV